MHETQEGSLEVALGFPHRRQGEPRQRALRTFQLRWVATLEGAFAAKGGALEAGEGGSVDVMLVRDATVHGLTCHLLVPLALGAGHCDAGSLLKGRGGHSEWRLRASQVRGHTLLPRQQLRALSITPCLLSIYYVAALF